MSRRRCRIAARGAGSGVTTETPGSSGAERCAARSAGTRRASPSPPSCTCPSSCAAWATRPAQSRTILFTDSRDDAARTAAGVARNHFRDLIRQLIRQVMDERPPDPLAVLRKAAASPASLDDSEQYILNSYIAEHPEAWRLIQKEQFVPLTPEERAVLDMLAQAVPEARKIPWGELQAQISTRLVNLGVPPGRSRPVDAHDTGSARPGTRPTRRPGQGHGRRCRVPRWPERSWRLPARSTSSSPRRSSTAPAVTSSRSVSAGSSHATRTSHRPRRTRRPR